MLFGSHFINNGTALVVAQLSDTSLIASYLLTVRILVIIRSLSISQFNANYPSLINLVVSKNFYKVKKSLSLIIRNAILVLCITLFTIFLSGNDLINFFSKDIRIIDDYLFIIMSIGIVLEAHHGFHANIYLSTNHVPFLWPGLISGLLIILISFILVHSYGLLGIVLTQFFIQLSFNNWFPVYLNLKLLKWNFSEYSLNILNLKKSMIALLPIKEHSERIPNKSFKTIDNKPLFSFVIDTLLSSNFISKVAINTDSPKIISEVKKLYPSNLIEFINRPKELIGDFVPMNDIIKYDINQFENNLFIQTHITNPLLKTQTIDNAILFYKNNTYDSIVSVNEHKSRFYDRKQNPINHDGSSNILRTQDLEPLYEENSCFYIFSKDSFTKSGNNRIGNKPFYFTINKLESIDIDYYEDLQLARALYKGDELKKNKIKTEARLGLGLLLIILLFTRLSPNILLIGY